MLYNVAIYPRELREGGCLPRGPAVSALFSQHPSHQIRPCGRAGLDGNERTADSASSARADNIVRALVRGGTAIADSSSGRLWFSEFRSDAF